jgi:hypothetical protein
MKNALHLFDWFVAGMAATFAVGVPAIVLVILHTV